MELDEQVKPEQSAIQFLSFEDRLTFAKSLKRAVEQTNDPEEKKYYKTRIRELFKDEEWIELKRGKTQWESKSG